MRINQVTTTATNLAGAEFSCQTWTEPELVLELKTHVIVRARATYQELCLNLIMSDAPPRKLELGFTSSVSLCKANVLIVQLVLSSHCPAPGRGGYAYIVRYTMLPHHMQLVGTTTAVGNTAASARIKNGIPSRN